MTQRIELFRVSSDFFISGVSLGLVGCALLLVAIATNAEMSWMIVLISAASVVGISAFGAQLSRRAVHLIRTTSPPVVSQAALRRSRSSVGEAALIASCLVIGTSLVAVLSAGELALTVGAVAAVTGSGLIALSAYLRRLETRHGNVIAAELGSPLMSSRLEIIKLRNGGSVASAEPETRWPGPG